MSQPHKHDDHEHTDVCPVTGHVAAREEHAFCPAKKTDSRSPCPALNALANHGYLPRDGKRISAKIVTNALEEGYHCSGPLAYVLAHGGFLLLGQRGQTICLADLARHNRIEHNASLAHPDAGHRDEYAPTHVHKDLLEEFLAHSKDGELITPDDVARARVRRESVSGPVDGLHAEIARGEMAIVMHLFNNPNADPELHEKLGDYNIPNRRRSIWKKLKSVVTSGPSTKPRHPDAPLPGVPVEWLRTWIHEERFPDGWHPYHKVGLVHTMEMSATIRTAMKKHAQNRATRRRTLTFLQRTQPETVMEAELAKSARILGQAHPDARAAVQVSHKHDEHELDEPEVRERDRKRLTIEVDRPLPDAEPSLPTPPLSSASSDGGMPHSPDSPDTLKTPSPSRTTFPAYVVGIDKAATLQVVSEETKRSILPDVVAEPRGLGISVPVAV
ncbi:heme-thiolate peroxidase [Gelatoporia subvermispora B]|uniref:Heme-thiolate peroxidase n=1 Tax=Ceriporiopsis subvermispora (strain B) TaxID=914234 RepID=M2PCT5_CERS8|nr:heme-thiolate peroxidase [Gelatoporia subvermispora B]